MTSMSGPEREEPAIDLAGLDDPEFNSEIYERLMTLNATVAVIVINDEEYEVTVNDEGFEIALVFEAGGQPTVSIGFSSEGNLTVTNEGGRDIGAFTAVVITETMLELERNRHEKAIIARKESIE